MLIGEMVVGFRDSAYLYYPLFKWIDGQWAQGVLPLWNPQCNFGIPVVHDGSSSVFYPGKLIFWLRQLPYPARYGIYLAIHVPVAAGGTYWFARVLRATSVGATLAAIAYAFSGPVLFQMTNAVYLVSAAWLPYSLACIWLMFRRRHWKWAVLNGVFCALMILGGDPQMCYHVGLIMGAFAVWDFWRARQRRFRVGVEREKLQKPLLRFAGALSLSFLTIGVTACLAAIQILPSYHWSQESIRTRADTDRILPRNVYELLSTQIPSTRKPLLSNFYREPDKGTHLDHAYQFSQPPWTLPELIWPNVSGKAYPANERWIDALPAAERMWNPSLFCGSFVLLLALWGGNPLGSHRKYAWLARIALCFLIASFGWYGSVWLLRELFPGSSILNSVGPQVGGLYWLMQIGLPKYVAFRYPAKLVIVAILAISVLAGLNLDRLFRKPDFRRLRYWVIVGLILSAVLVLAAPLMVNQGAGSVSALFGPFDDPGCLQTIWLASASTAVVLALGYLLVICHHRWAHGAICRLAVVGVCALEIILANQWLVPLVDVSYFESPGKWSEWVASSEANHSGRITMPIVYRNEGLAFPANWVEEGSEQRLEEIVQWQRDSLQAKHHLNEGIQLIGSFSSLEPRRKVHPWGSPLDASYRLVRDSQNRWRMLDTGERGYEFVRCKNYPALRGEIQWCWLNGNELEITVDGPAFKKRSSYLTHLQIGIQLQSTRGWKIELETDGHRVPMDCKMSNDIREDPCTIDLPVTDEIQKIHVRYQPAEFYLGAWISGISWLGIGVVLLIPLRNSRN